MSRRRITSDDGLDMLLDAITNTFGGIVFLAILVVIMTGAAKPKASESTTTAEFREIQEEIADLQFFKNELAQSQSAQQIVAACEQIETDKATAEKIRGLAQEYLKLRAQLGDVFEERTQANSAMAKGFSEKHTLNQRLATESTNQRTISGNLEREIDERTVEIDAPRERESRKSQVIAFVINERLYFLDSNFGNGEFRINKAHFTPCAESDAMLVLKIGHFCVKPGAGVPLSEHQPLVEELLKVNKEENFVALIFYEDSFARYRELREIMRQSDLDHELVLMKMGEVVSEAPRIAAPRVQN